MNRLTNFIQTEINWIISAFGFKDVNDFAGNFFIYAKKLSAPVTFLGGSFGFIESTVQEWTGIGVFLWSFFIAASVFNIFLGAYVNVQYLNEELSKDKLQRGLFKTFTVLFFTVLVYYLRRGLENQQITVTWAHDLSIYLIATTHYIVVLLAGLYILLDIAKNGAKTGNSFFVSLEKILTMKIKNVEKKAGNDENME